MKVPFFDYQRFGLNNLYTDVFQNVCRSGYFIGGPFVAEFEAAIQSYTGIKHCVAVANATDALEIIGSFLKIDGSSEVLVPGHTMTATASAFKHGGAKVICTEVSLGSHLIDANSIQKSITKSTTHVVVTQLNGMSAPMDEIEKICEDNNLVLIEDSAQGLGCFYKAQHVGGFGIAGCLSFYPAKNLGCLGDGGAILTNNSELADYARVARDHGRSTANTVEILGRNSRLDSLQAAILIEKLSHYDNVLDKRRKIASIYDSRLGKLAKSGKIYIPQADSSCTHAYQNYEIQVYACRDSLKLYLAEHGVGTLIQWSGIPLTQVPYVDSTVDVQNFYKEFFSTLLLLPMNDLLSENDVVYVCDVINSYYDV